MTPRCWERAPSTTSNSDFLLGGRTSASAKCRHGPRGQSVSCAILLRPRPSAGEAGTPPDPATMAATNKCLARINKSSASAHATNQQGALPAARRDFDAAERLDPLRVSAAGLSPPFAARSRAEAEYELSLFHCLCLCAYCVEPCRLCDPSGDRRLLFH